MRNRLFPTLLTVIINAFIALISVIITVPAFAAPITLDTALPVAKGESLLRIQSIYMRSTRDPTSMDRSLSVWAFPFVVGYGVTEKLALFGIFPILDKKIDVTTPAGRISRGDSGLGDSTFIARYTVWNQDRPGETMRIAPFIALKTPTGEDAKEDAFGHLPQPLQLGSGSWDPTAGIVGTWQTLNRQIDASASYAFKTEANNFRFGDVARLDVSYQHRLWPRELGEGVPGFVYGVLESNFIWEDKSRVGDVRDNDSGGTTWYLTPGIEYVTKRLVVEAAVQMPAIQELNGNALKNDYIVILGIRGNF